VNEARLIVEGFVRRFDTQLAQAAAGSAWLVGDAPTIADFSAYHALWFVRLSPQTRALLVPFEHVARWMQAMRSFGHGTPAPISPADALEIARAATPATIEPSSDLEDFPPGAAVEVLPTDYAFDPVAGELLRLSTDEIAVRRTDARAGQTVVHFPRTGYEIRKPG
jgi:hypothetical protein